MQPYVLLFCICIQCSKLFIPYLLQIGGLCLCYICIHSICAQSSYFVRRISVFICVKVFSVCVCMCVSVCSSSSFKCCYLLLLFFCCHRNTIVAKLPLLPRYFISCSLFPLSDSELGLVPPHITPLPPTGCWQFCSSLG